jgi:O-antigen ligase/Tfp pilus assembly protein PilF
MVTKAVARWAVYIPLFIIPFLPLYVANDLFFPFITGKGFAFRILVEIAAAGYLVLAIADKAYRPRFSWTFVLYAAFVVWMFLADIFSVNPHKAIWSNFERMEGWVTLVHVFLFFVVASAVLSIDKLWRWWWFTFIGATVIFDLYCLLQLSGAIAIHQGGVRVDGTLGNAAYLAAYLLFALAVTVWQAFASKGALRYALFVVAFVDVVLIFFSATRGAILGLIGAAIVAAALWAFESGGKTRNAAIGLLAVVVILAGGVYLLRDASFVHNDPTLARVTSIGPSDLTVRFTLWHMALEGVAERPILGWGQEGFNYIFNKYYEPSLYAQEPWFDRAHNVFIDWLVAGGVPALLLFLGVLLTALYALYRRDVSREERILLVAAVVAYAIQGMVVFDNLFTYVPLAALLAMGHVASSRPWKRLETLPHASESTLQMTAPLAVVLAVVAIWFVNVSNVRAASELVHAISISSTDITPNVTYFQEALNEHAFAHQEVREQLMMFATNIASVQQNPSQALAQLMSFATTQMQQEVALTPNDARLRMQLAIGYRAAGDYKDALAQIELAHQESPKKQSILLEQGLDYWQLGQYAQARDSFQQAYDLDHSFKDLVAYPAAGKIITGDLAGGKKLLVDTIGTTTVNNEALLLAYYQAKDFPDLILVLEQQVHDQNNSAESEFRLAAAYVAAGMPQQARAEVQLIVSQHPETASQAADFLTHVK